MNVKSVSLLVISPIVAVLVLFFLLPTTAFAQDIGAQAAIPGSLQQGSWYEQWNQAGTTYCPNNRQRYITTTSEPFTLSAPAGEETISIFYANSRLRLYLARTPNGDYVYTNENSWWVHLIVATRLSPTQMSIVSSFFAKDGSCTITNYATWSFASAPTQSCTVIPNSVAVNKRSGPGLNFTIVGQLLPNTTAAVINVAYDGQGRRWWLLSDNTWVSSVVVTARGSCPS